MGAAEKNAGNDVINYVINAVINYVIIEWGNLIVRVG